MDSNYKNTQNQTNENSNSNAQSLEIELTLKQRELEEKNRELFAAKHEIEYLQKNYDKIYDNSPAGYFTFDKNGTILSINNRGSELLGAKKGQLLNESFFNLITPEDQLQFKIHLENVFEFKTRHSCEIKIERKDKSLFYALLESIPFNENYKKSCITAVSDITGLKVAQDELRESEERFKNMANTTPVLMWISDPEAFFTFVNKFWEEFTGRTLGQEIGLNWIEGIHTEDLKPFISKYKSACDARKPFEIEYRLKTHNGSYKWVINKGVPRFQSDGRFAGYIGSCTDINDQKMTEETVKKFNEDLKNLNSSKDKFFSIIAHDLKSPLAGLLGFTEILLEEFGELHDDEKKEFIGHAHQAAKNLNALLENLLEWSRIQIGGIIVEPETINVEHIFDEIMNLFAQNAANKKIRLSKSVNPDFTVFADKNSVKTILRNLVSNGIKFTNVGGGIYVSAEIDGEFAKICVQDSGIGISQENIDKLFRIDVNYTTFGTNQERGTGLGLILCKELVEKNNGKIWVESEVSRGTKFIFTLPMKKIKSRLGSTQF